MSEIPDVGAIAQQVKARIKHIEDQLKQHHVLTDELERLRAALVRLEGQARSRVSTGRGNRITLFHYHDIIRRRSEVGDHLRHL